MMPKYHYQCGNCARDWWQWNSISESDIQKCPSCLESLVTKVPTSFTTISQPPSHGNKKVGEETKNSIEENREVLKKMRSTAASKEYIPDD